MTRDDIIRMAEKSGLLNPPQDGLDWSAPVPKSDYLQKLERFADLVLRAERQACAELVQVHMTAASIDMGVAICVRERK